MSPVIQAVKNSTQVFQLILLPCSPASVPTLMSMCAQGLALAYEQEHAVSGSVPLLTGLGLWPPAPCCCREALHSVMAA